MINEPVNLNDHKEHDPSRCDFARIWLTQQFVAGTVAEHIENLSVQQLVVVGFTSAMFSGMSEVADNYAMYGLTLEQVFEFSEYLRDYLITKRGMQEFNGAPEGNPLLN